MPDIQQEWKPNAKQERFLALPYEIFEALYGGSGYSGKTEILGLSPLMLKTISCPERPKPVPLIEHPRFKALLLRRTFPQLEQEMIPRLEHYFKAAGGSWNGTTKCWTWRGGARIYYGHMEHETDVKKYDTSEWHYVGFDELTSFTEYQYLYFVGSRCRSSFADLPAIVRSATNPGNIGNKWVKDRFLVDKVPSLTILRQTFPDGSVKLRTYLQAMPSDNTRVPKECLAAYLASLELLPEAEKRAKKYGDWNAFEGQVFTEFRRTHLDVEPANAIHVIEPFELPSWWPTILAMDWGYSAWFYALWGKVSPDKRIYVYREYAQKKRTASDNAAEISYISANDNICSISIDPSARQHHGESKDNKSIFQQVSEGLSDNLSVLLHVAVNDRVAGKNLLHDYLRWTPRPRRTAADKSGYSEEIANRVLRFQGLEAYKDYLKSFEDEPLEQPGDLPRLQIFNTCPLLIEAIPSCVYDEVNKEDVKEFEGDDPYDDIRYLLFDVDEYVRDSQHIFEKQKQLQAIEERLLKTNDYQSYFMSMRTAHRSSDERAFPRYKHLRLGR